MPPWREGACYELEKEATESQAEGLALGLVLSTPPDSLTQKVLEETRLLLFILYSFQGNSDAQREFQTPKIRCQSWRWGLQQLGNLKNEAEAHVALAEMEHVVGG